MKNVFFQSVISQAVFLTIYVFVANAAGLSKNANLSNTARLMPYRRIDLRKLITSMLDVQCTEKSIMITYRFNRRYALFMGEWYTVLKDVQLILPELSIESDKEKCGAVVQNDPGNIILPYCQNCCGMTMLSVLNNHGNATIFYQTSIKVSLNNSSDIQSMEEQRHNIFDVSCTHDTSLKEGKFGSIDFSIENTHNPTNLRSTLFKNDEEALFHLELNNVTKFLPADLKTFPVDCWFDANLYNVERRYFINDGCPSKDDQDRGLSSISHFSSGYTRVAVPISDFLTEKWTRSNRTDFSINCRLIVCTHSGLHAVFGVPRCPLTTYCSMVSEAGQIILPDAIKSGSKFLTVQSKPLEFVRNEPLPIKRYSQTTYNYAKPKTNKCECPPVAAMNSRKMRTISNNNNNNNNNIINDDDNVIEKPANRNSSGSTVIFVSLLSFLFGALVTALVWQRKIRFIESQKFEQLPEMQSLQQQQQPEEQDHNILINDDDTQRTLDNNHNQSLQYKSSLNYNNINSESITLSSNDNNIDRPTLQPTL